MNTLEEKKKIVEEMFRSKVAVIAFSGGVDSTLVVALAKKSASKVIAVTADSCTLPPGELNSAKRIAQEIGVQHLIVEVDELKNKDFAKNPTNRCFYCKQELINHLEQIAQEYKADIIAEGTNVADLKGHRPGFTALRERGVISPLAEAGISKDEVRTLARNLELSVAEKPSTACLSSRIPYGTEITMEVLTRIGLAEEFIRAEFDIKVLRVRDHNGLARIEVGQEDMKKIISQNAMQAISKKLKLLGYTWVTLDLGGFRSGAMNEALEAEELEALSPGEIVS